MKILLLFLTVYISVSSVFSQQENIERIDKRAFNIYSSEDISKMPPEKIDKVNFLIRESFIIPNEMKDLIKLEDINGMDYTSFRSENERVKVPVLLEKEVKSQYYIILLSFKELDIAYQKIKEKYN